MSRIRLMRLMNDHFRECRSLYIFVIALFMVGIVFGGIVVNSLPYGTKLDLLHYMEQFFGELSRGQIADPRLMFRESLINDLQYIGLIWLLGLSVIGLPIIFLLIFIKGLVLGFTVGFLVSQMGVNGFLASLVSIFPQNMLLIPADLFISVIAVVCCLKVFRQLLIRTRREPLWPQMFGYVLLLLPACVLVFAASSFEAYLSPSLIRLFLN